MARRIVKRTVKRCAPCGEWYGIRDATCPRCGIPWTENLNYIRQHRAAIEQRLQMERQAALGGQEA